jgi:outer membrane receptor protein involved in Fe transport
VGQYELRVESRGFSPYVNNAIVISIGRAVQLTMRLAPARVQQEITVSEQPPPIDATQTSEATTIDHERIEESPVVSRNYLDFALMAPQLTRSNIQGATGGKSALADSGISIAGLIDFGRPYNGNDKRRENHYELSDEASAAQGRHLFSFGADLDWIRERISAYDGFGAIYVFPTLDSFVSGQPDEYRQTFGTPITSFASPRYSGFVQDHWTVTNHFTIDAGVRYDFEHLPAQFAADTNDFAPRIGLAYSPSPTWALRAGFGIFFDRYLLAAANRALEMDGVQGFEQVAYGQAATQIFQSEDGTLVSATLPLRKPAVLTASKVVA